MNVNTTPTSRRSAESANPRLRSAMGYAPKIAIRRIDSAIIYAARDCRQRLAHRWRVDDAAKGKYSPSRALVAVVEDLHAAGAAREDVMAAVDELRAFAVALYGPTLSLDVVDLSIAETVSEGQANPAQMAVVADPNCPTKRNAAITALTAHVERLWDLIGALYRDEARLDETRQRSRERLGITGGSAA